MSRQQSLMTNLTQAQQIGSSNPPNLSSVSPGLMASADPNTNLLLDTRTIVDKTPAISCRDYKGLEGLRRLRADQLNRTALDAGCGWRFKPASTGMNPDISQGALGNINGPAYPTEDSLSGGTRWYWNLDEAEKEVSKATCTNAFKNCTDLSRAGQYASMCGYCRATGAIIPIKNTRQGIQARYPNDPSLSCPREMIVNSTNTRKCAEGFQGTNAPREGFQNMTGTGGLGGAASGQTNILEAFETLTSLDECEPPLTRECVVLAAKLAGCSDKGTLVQALQSAPSPGDYDSLLTKERSYVAYKSTNAPQVTGAILRDGSASVETALADFGKLKEQTMSQNQKTRAAANDLCLKKGDFDTYNFCMDITDNDMINDTNFKCVQEIWKQRGGTEMGTQYPKSIDSVRNMTFKAFKDSIARLENGVKSTDKTTQSNAILQFIGQMTDSPANYSFLPINDTTRGGEIVWIDTVDFNPGTAPIILRCDLRLAKDEGVVPRFWNKNELAAKYNVPADFIAFSFAFEYRLPQNSWLQWWVGTDDGFMLSLNQNPFEGTGNRRNDWGSWRYQGPTGYISPYYTIYGENEKKNNICVGKWFQGGGAAYFHMNQLLNTGNNNSWWWWWGWSWYDQENGYSSRNYMCVTQEPLAPWCQYEVCTRNGQNGFFEKRWNGIAAVMPDGQNTKPSFEIVSNSIVLQTDKTRRTDVPASKPYISLNSGSWWHTRSRFAFAAFRTITLLVRPQSTLAVGTQVSVFVHANFETIQGNAIYLKNNGGASGYTLQHWSSLTSGTTDVPVTMNEWNLIVIQYVGDNRGIRSTNVSAAPLLSLRNKAADRKLFLQTLTGKQTGGSRIVFPNATADRTMSGFLALGGTCPDYKARSGRVEWQLQSFTGDVAWVHGFRNYIDTEDLLAAEVNQNWISRWPLGNLASEEANAAPEYDNFKVYRANEIVMFNGNRYKFRNFIGAAGYGPSNYPSAWELQ